MAGPRLIGAYADALVAASRSSMVELTLALRHYQDVLVLVGGWTPYFLIERFGRENPVHVGSIDIDLAIDPDRTGPDDYATIAELVERRGYTVRRSSDGQAVPFSFERATISPVNGEPYTISVDFLTSGPPEGRAHRHRRVQPGLPARIAKGCSIAFRHNMTVDVAGLLPGDGEARGSIRMLDITGCLGMKGIVLGERYSEKDAYDVFSVVGQCLGGPLEVASEVRPHLGDAEVAAGIEAIRKRFRDLDAEGPSWVAAFLQLSSPTMRERATAEAYVTMRRFLDAL
jgi:hypothetical protein